MYKKFFEQIKKARTKRLLSSNNIQILTVDTYYTAVFITIYNNE